MAATNSQTAQPKPLPRQFPREYVIWCSMRQRCRNPNSQGYRYYGARGIRVSLRTSASGGHRVPAVECGKGATL